MTDTENLAEAIRRKSDPLSVHLNGILASQIRLAVNPRNGESPCNFQQ
jgi:hypothetical protein